MSHAKLPPPPALAEGALRIYALGGLGEIGRNMTVFEFDGRLLVVDCGVLFPEENQPGVDVILPDFTWIRDRLDAIEAIVLTHGHIDHAEGARALAERLRVEVRALDPAHRLDRETSGVILVAKNRKTMAALAAMFSEAPLDRLNHSYGKSYADLPPEAKAACEDQARKLVGDGRAFKDTASWRKYYAEVFFSQGE